MEVDELDVRGSAGANRTVAVNPDEPSRCFAWAVARCRDRKVRRVGAATLDDPSADLDDSTGRCAPAAEDVAHG